ncbi:hypothetical protein [uncultured Fibrobacter sp.]|uniref:hypothetical protein n=1 Tax=uncultured Fibrobacter sp. TaxID=261512 RepID=UPI002606252C|nr:hypothetical protein [uncultured Fibrobacter sp.]
MFKLFKVVLAVLLAFATLFAKEPDGNKKYDIDISRMSGTMVYGQVYQMVMYPSKYLGKHIKMKGIFSSYYDEELKRRFYGCVIADALACCSQGLAFELAKPRKYPEQYPAEGDAIVVEGDFDYEKDEGGSGFPIIRNAEMQTEK